MLTRAIVITLALAATSANAQLTGNKFLQDRDSLYWLGYVSAIADDLSNEGVDLGTTRMKICLPADSNYGQYVRVALKHVEAHPERQHAPARFLIMEALIDAFPCPAVAP